MYYWQNIRHLPVGVLFDSIFLKQASIELPWRITVHFQTFPMDKLLRFSNDNDIQFNYINAVKQVCNNFFCILSIQASQVKYGSTKTVMTLRKEDQAALWNAIRDCNLNDFEKIKASTFDQSPAKAFPIRVLYGNEKKAQSSLFVINSMYCNVILIRLQRWWNSDLESIFGNRVGWNTGKG